MLLQTIVLLSVWTGVYSQNHGFIYPPNCAPPNMTTVSPNLPAGTQAPPFPYIPNTFQTRIEANIIDKGYTLVAEEYYDYPNNRAALRLLKNNTQTYVIFDYQNDQILYVDNGGCYASDLQYDNNKLLFGMKSGLKGVPHLYSTPNSLHFAQANGLQYMGRSTVRGIPADHWQSCMTWPLLASNFTLDYYFTAYGSSYMEPDLSSQVPLRAVATGVMMTIDEIKQFTHVYEYFDFRNRIWEDESVFETPRGVVCKGRKQTRPVPKLAARFSFREEIISPDHGFVQTADVWYDYKDKRVRFDYRPPFPAYPLYTTNLVTEVHDYSTGIAYAFDRDNGNCTTLPIENTTFEGYINTTTSDGADQFYMQLKTPHQLFYLDDTSYTYEGVRNCRGMLCDVFISTRTDFTLPLYGPFNSTFEMYFLKNGWEATNLDKTGVPIQMTIITPDWVGFKATYNIYDFQENFQDSAFDVTSCYDDDKKQPFVVKFEGSYDPATVNKHRSSFIDVFRERMQTKGFSPIRIQNVKLRIERENLYVTGMLLDLPPVLGTGTLLKLPSDMPLETGWIAIKNYVFSGNFQIDVAGKTYTATAIDSSADLNGNQTLASETLLAQFEVHINKCIPGYDDLIITGHAVDGCAKICLSQKHWVCNSFTYSFETGYCFLSKLRPDTKQISILKPQSCNLYIRK